MVLLPSNRTRQVMPRSSSPQRGNCRRCALFRRSKGVRGLVLLAMASAALWTLACPTFGQVEATPPAPPVPGVANPAPPAISDPGLAGPAAPNGSAVEKSSDVDVCSRLPGPFGLACDRMKPVVGAVENPAAVPGAVAGAVLDKAAGLTVEAITDWVVGGAGWLMNELS